MDVHSISTKCTRTEFVGTAVLDTIGLVISGVDDTLLKEIQWKETLCQWLSPHHRQQ